MAQPRTIIDKIRDTHVVTRRDDGHCLLYVQWVPPRENSFHAFDKPRRVDYPWLYRPRAGEDGAP